MDVTRQLAHEIKAPLLSLELRLQKLVEEAPAPHSDLAESCLHEVAALKRLVANLLELEPRALAPQPIDVTPLLARVEQRLRPLAAGRGVKLVIEPAGARVVADAQATERILVNLVDNAIKFSPRGSEVRVHARTHDDRREVVEVEVCDDGVGIATDARERVFEPFFRVDREVEGAGLGLAVSKRLAEAQNGTLRCESQLGHGSRFTLALPATSP